MILDLEDKNNFEFRCHFYPGVYVNSCMSNSEVWGEGEPCNGQPSLVGPDQKLTHAQTPFLNIECFFRLCTRITTGKQFALKCLLDSPKARTEVRIQLRNTLWVYPLINY